MSRKLHLVEVTDEQLKRFHKARLVAAAVVIVFFAGFIAFAPEVEPTKDATPAVTASAPE